MVVPEDENLYEEESVQPDPDAVEHLRRESGEVDPHVIDLAASDGFNSANDAEQLRNIQAEKPDSFYSDLIYSVAHLRYEEEDARKLWLSLLRHKWHLSQKLGRNVGISVAALDYFRNVTGRLRSVKIIDSVKYVETSVLALTDGLTGVFNHRAFMDILQKEIRMVNEDGGDLCIIMMDLDHFKTYNDANGHVAGDVALREFAQVVRHSIKKDDIIARYGGEEFVAILRGADKDGAVSAADRIRRSVEETTFPNESVMPSGNLTVSCGIAACPEDGSDRTTLLNAADKALYRAKAEGRNRVCSA